MARESSLLKRIAECDERRSRRIEPTASEDLEALMESVRIHLAQLLNARHGMSEALPDYGLPALTDLTIGSADYLPAVQDAIKQTIEKYEPRLRRIEVKPIFEDDDEKEDKRKLYFAVKAVLISQSGEHRVYYETAVTRNGGFGVSG